MRNNPRLVIANSRSSRIYPRCKWVNINVYFYSNVHYVIVIITLLHLIIKITFYKEIHLTHYVPLQLRKLKNVIFRNFKQEPSCIIQMTFRYLT